MREKSSLLPRKIGLAKEKLVLGMLLLGGKKKKKMHIFKQNHCHMEETN